MVAVPPSALGQMKDANLILLADRKKLLGASGFADHRWPDLSNPEWGAREKSKGEHPIFRWLEKFQKSEGPYYPKLEVKGRQ